MKKANILAINMALRPQSPVKIFPIGLAYVLSSVKRSEYDFELLDIDKYRFTDEDIRRKLEETEWHIVLLGCIVTGYKKVKKLAAEIRATNPEALIVVGNSVASSIPDILLKNTEADVAVIGEGDVAIVEVLDKWISKKGLNDVKGIYYSNNDQIIKNPEREVISNINDIPPPIYDIFDVEEYISAQRNIIGEPLPMDREVIRSFPLNTARGCPNRCTFCYHCFIDKKYRYRSAMSIVDEIKLLKETYNINYVLLWDDLTFFSKKQISEFVDLVLKEKLEVSWIGAVRGNLFQETKDIELLIKMKDAGCIRLGYALESADEVILKAMKKRVSLSQFRKQKELMDTAGIASGTSIVLGYPQETPETIAKTYQFCLDLGIYPSTGFLLPQPATPIYDWAKREGFIKDEEEFLLQMGDRQDLRINLTKMSNEEFEDHVTHWLMKLNHELKIGIDEKSLIKTLYKRGGKASN